MSDSSAALLSFVPIDRRLALARGQALPDRARGAALVADVSGFTPLTEALAVAYGPQRGAEELTRHLDLVYGSLITPLEHFGGSVVSFSGDAITCWFDQDSGLRAVAAALAMQAAMQALPVIRLSQGVTVQPALKVAVAHGAVRRLLVGDPHVHRLEVLAGGLLDTLGALQGGAARGEVVLDAATAQTLANDLTLAAGRSDPSGVVVAALTHPVEPQPWPALTDAALSDSDVRPWLVPAIYEQLRRGGGEFLATLRPAVALFAGFSGIDYDDDDDAGLLLDAYVRSVQATLARYEILLVNLSIGDKGSYLHAVAGAPVAHDDDAARAVAAALELLMPAAQLSFVSDLRIGLAQGQMYCGAYGGAARRTFGVQGDKTNLAARLMEHAAHGTILCDDDVYRPARRRWEFAALPPLRVKGKAGLIRVYQPTGRAATSAEQAGNAAGTPLVGRAAELAQLEAALEALQGGRGGMVTLEGEAGIGKSRLVEELIRKARARGFSGLIGAGLSIEQQTAYRAWRDLLGSFFDLDEVGDAAERRARVQQAGQELIPKQLARLPLLNDILALGLPETPLTLALDAALRQESLTGLVVALLRAWTRERPLIVVLEDAHWLDGLSWQLVRQVARALWSEASPLLLVLVSRELDEASPGAQAVAALRALAPGICDLRLGPLDPDETVALATQRLGLPAGHLPGEIAALVRERAGGNPFFAEEIAHSLLERGLIRVEPEDAPDDEAAEPTTPVRVHCIVCADPEAMQALLPETLHGLILARIDRLPADQQFTLKVAAVIGRQFTYSPLRDTLQHLGPVLEETLPAHLEALTRHDLTALEAAEPDLTYIFRHIVIHDATYATLLFAQRKQIHRVVAEWYQARWQAEQHAAAGPGVMDLPLLVYHFHRAEAWDEERRFAQLAGEDAARKHANADAVQYLSRALELTPAEDLPARFELLLAQERVLELQGERAAQAAALSQLAEWAAALDTPRQATVALHQAGLAYQTGDYPAAVASASQAVALAAEAGLTETQAQANLQWGMALWQQASYGEAQARNQQALDLARQAGLVEIEANCLRQQGVIYDSQGDYPAARRAMEAALPLHQAAGDQRGEAKCLNSLGVVAYNQEDHPAANAYYEQSLHLKRELGDRYGQGITLQNLGIVANDLGQFLPAADYFALALALCREIGDREGEASALDGLGLMAVQLGDYAQAETVLEQSLAISREIGEKINESSSLGSLSTVRHLKGDHAAALALSQAALDIAQEAGTRYYEAGAWQQVGQARLGVGQNAEAAAAYRQALSLYEAMDKPRYAVEPLAGLARATLALGALAEAQAHIETILGLIANDPLAATAIALRTYWTCYQVLQAAGDGRAPAVLERAHAYLQARAAAIADEAAREKFLTSVPWNRAVEQAWQTQPRLPAST